MVQYCVSDKRLFFLGLFFFITMSISGIYSLSNVVNSTENSLSTSFVDIDVRENDISEIVMPGSTVLLEPKVNNLGIDCYLRVSISYTIGGVVMDEANYINGDFSSWTKKDNYYYYDSILMKNGSVKLFDNFYIPSNLSNEFQNKKVIIKVVAEAIQASNFEPDYSLDDPWYGVTVKEKANRSYSSDQSGSTTIIYENDVENYLTISNTFFNNLGNLLPGDSVSEFIDVNNTSRRKMNYFFAVSSENLTIEERNLLRAIRLKITDSDNQTVYNSSLLSESKNLIKSYDSGSTDRLKFIISVPSELDNDYSILFTKIIWKLSCEELGGSGSIPENPNTGDFEFDTSMKMFIFSFIGLLIVLTIMKINHRNRNNNI